MHSLSKCNMAKILIHYKKTGVNMTTIYDCMSGMTPT